MPIQKVPAAEKFAKLFLHYHQALAHSSESADDRPLVTWNAVPEDERTRLVNAARLALREIEHTETPAPKANERHFAKPGEAEWGC
jgi:hypothetical protein